MLLLIIKKSIYFRTELFFIIVFSFGAIKYLVYVNLTVWLRFKDVNSSFLCQEIRQYLQRLVKFIILRERSYHFPQ